MNYPRLDPEINKLLQEGTVIPAHPLALTADAELDEERQRALTRYYMAAGSGGIAVGVHTTQFEIRDPEVNLFETVLKMAAEEMDAAELDRPLIKVAGITGPAEQAVEEAGIAVKHGYHIGLVSNGGLNDASVDELIERTRKIAEIIPVMGFYLQPAVGGRILPYDFWRKFADIPNVYAIKLAPFNRYQTLDAVRAVVDSDRRDEIALYTGNDDNIIADLVTPYRFKVDGKTVEKRFVGGLLGHWAVWTSKAVELLDRIKKLDGEVPEDLLALNIETTDANAVLFDAANNFAGCIPGIHEVLRRQGLLEGLWCLNPDEKMSEGQSEELDRIYESYPHLTDDDFVRENLDEFFSSPKATS